MSTLIFVKLRVCVQKSILPWVTGDVLPLFHEMHTMIQAVVPVLHKLEYAAVREVDFTYFMVIYTWFAELPHCFLSVSASCDFFKGPNRQQAEKTKSRLYRGWEDTKTKLHGLSPQANYTDRLSDCHLLAKSVPTLADRGCRVVSATVPPQSLISVF
jgi:hypothetical protein